jgi:hypothetical protein
LSCEGLGDCGCFEPPEDLVDIEVFCWHQLVGWTPFDTAQYIGIHQPYDCSDGLKDRYLSKVRVERWQGIRDGNPFDGSVTTTQTQNHWTGQAASSSSGSKPIEADQAWIFDGSTYAINADAWHILEEYTYGASAMIHEITETLSTPYTVSQFLAECTSLYNDRTMEQLVAFAEDVDEQPGLAVKWLYLYYDENGNKVLSATGEKTVLEQSPYEGYWYDALYNMGVGTGPTEYPWFHFNGLQSIRVIGQTPGPGKVVLVRESTMRNVVDPYTPPCGPTGSSVCTPAPIPMDGYIHILRESAGKEIILEGTC